MRAIPDRQLAAEKIPTIESSWEKIERFGYSFDGYEAFGMDECARLADSFNIMTLRELRAVLFFELRVWRNNGYAPDAEAMAKFSWLLELIRRKVTEQAG